MSAVLNFNQALSTLTCYRCGIVFAVPQYFRTMRLDDKENFWCPNGHPQAFVKSEADRLREQLTEANRRLEWERGRVKAKEKEVIAQKGQITKLKNRISKGVCPCCKRSFSDLHRHMRSKHPDYGATGQEIS